MGRKFVRACLAQLLAVCILAVAVFTVFPTQAAAAEGTSISAAQVLMYGYPGGTGDPAPCLRVWSTGGNFLGHGGGTSDPITISDGTTTYSFVAVGGGGDDAIEMQPMTMVLDGRQNSRYALVGTPAFTYSDTASYTITIPDGFFYGPGPDGTGTAYITGFSGTSGTPAANQPTLISVSPNSGPTTGGNTVTLTFSDTAPDVDWVYFGENTTGQDDPNIVISGNTVTCPVPAGTGTVDVRAVWNTGRWDSTLPAAYTYTDPVPPPPPAVVDAAGSTVPTDTHLESVVASAGDASNMANLVTAQGITGNLIETLDITLLDSTDTPVDGNCTIRVNISGLTSNDTVTILHLHDGSPVKIPAVSHDGYATFQVSEFSLFGIVVQKYVAPPPNTPTPDPTPAPAPAATTPTSPQTGVYN